MREDGAIVGIIGSYRSKYFRKFAAFGPLVAGGLALALACPEALAAPKTVAIVNLCQELDGRQAAESARRSLEKSEALQPIPAGDLARALEAPLEGDDPSEPIIREARASLRQSNKAFLQFHNRLARSKLDEARQALFGLAPNEDSTALLADLSFNMALVHLREQNLGLALEELQLVHRLDPGRASLDPVRYPPDVVSAFKEGRRLARAKESASVRVSATYDGAPVFVDGVERGVSPLDLKLSPGTHLVTVASPQYQATTRRVELDPKDKRDLRFDLIPRSPVQQARELRFKVRGANESERRAAVLDAASHAAELVRSDAVLVISDDKGVARAALFDQRLERLSFSRPVNASLGGLFGLIVEVPSPPLIQDREGDEDKPWYRQPWGLVSIAGGVAATVVTSFIIGTGNEPLDDRAGTIIEPFAPGAQ